MNHCPQRNKSGGCQLHNLQCGYPACDTELPPRDAAAPSAPAPAEVPCPTCGSRSMRIACFRCRPAEVPMPEPDQTDVDCELWGQNSKVDVWYRESVLTYAAGREAAALERVRGVLRELVESYRSLINTLGHEDATAADKEKAEARFACAEAAARAELGEKP